MRHPAASAGATGGISAFALAVAVAVAVAVAAAATATAAACAAPAEAAGASKPAKPVSASTASRWAHVAFGNCTARHITLSVTVPTHAFDPSEEVAVTVRLRNTGSTNCGGPLAQHVPEAHHALTLGPCGTLPITVHTDSGGEVYPGTEVLFCPNEGGFQLAPHSTVQATARWNQVAYVGTGTPPEAQHAAPGTYRFTVDRVVTVPVMLISS